MQDNYRTIANKLETLKEFTGNSMRGRWEDGRFIVYSYSTPIAIWQTSLVKEVTERKYSVTTSRHQNLIRRAWGIK
jgi:hypothetical protein